MKNKLLYALLFLIWCNVGFAETYLCSYIHNQEPRSLVFERAGQSFNKSNGATDEIIYEDRYAIVLSATYTLNGTEAASTFSTIIDKERLTFVFIGLEYQNNTSISQGKCKLL